MNNAKYGNYAKLIAFFLVAAILVVGFGFATDGRWQEEQQKDQHTLNGNNEGEDVAASGSGIIDTPKEPQIYIPQYINSLTGEEASENASRKRHYAFIFDPSAPLYGISAADLVAEFPIESGDTRFLTFINNVTQLNKIGSLLPTRSYISNVAKFFNSIIIASGNDGSLNYDRCDVSGALFDMSVHPGYFYTEYLHFTYTSGNLIEAGLSNANINTTLPKNSSIPYTFADFGKEITPGEFEATSVIIPYSSKSETELYYSSAQKKYSLNKNGISKSDMLSDKKIGYTNLFVIFTDTMTYEGHDSTEMVMSTIGSGTGYYISEGTGQNITWKSDAIGNLTFYDAKGEKLVINRGNSYIGFAKSAKVSDVKIS